MDACYLCNNPLTAENVSKEHIVLNSIGGRLKSKELLCKTCNSKFGHDADSELAGQLVFLSSYFQVKRDSGETPIIKGAKTKDGKEYNILDGSKPSLSKPKFDKKVENGETRYSIEARNEKELITILKGLRRKHPELDLELAKQKFQWKEEYLEEHLSHSMTIGGDLAFKSIVKTAVNYYIHSQKETEQVKHLFPYLKGEADLKIGKHFYPAKPIYKKESNEVVHLIHLYGNKHSKQLYCFVELFSAYSFLVHLSDKYDGKNFSSTYCYDILQNKELAKQVTLKLKAETVSEIYEMTKNDFETITEKLNRVMSIGSKIQTDKEIGNIVRKSIDKVFEKYKYEPVITEQMINEFSQEVAHAYAKFAFRGKRHNEF
jgi:hypothetical protein